MPEFEETNSQPNPNHSYTPRTDAAQKPRSRRRSGGFKTEVAASTTAGIGEINAATALNSEKLSGHACSQDPNNSSKPERKPEPTDTALPSKEAADTELDKISQKQGASCEPQAHRLARAERTTNPQPSAATLAAIKTVESSITERRNQRNARRTERENNHLVKNTHQRETRSNKPAVKQSPNRSVQKNGLLGAISRFFAKLFAGAPTPINNPTPKDSRSKRQSVNHSGKRGRIGQTRPTGNRSEQNRRAGNRSRSNQRQHSEKRHTTHSH